MSAPLHFYSPVHFEPWDWRNLDTGIGGSETHHIEMVWRLARRGHEVISYAPIPPDNPEAQQWLQKHWSTCTDPALRFTMKSLAEAPLQNTLPDGWQAHNRGVIWKPLEAANFADPGIWVLYRCPDVLDRFPIDHPDQQLWIVMQDESYPTWTDERCAKVDKVLAFCRAHYDATATRQPLLKDKLVRTSNGLRMDLVRDVEAATTLRDVVLGLDWGGSLEANPSLRQLARDVRAAGGQVHVIPALGPVTSRTDTRVAATPAEVRSLYERLLVSAEVPYDSLTVIEDDGDPEHVALAKLAALRRVGATAFYDDHPVNVLRAQQGGIWTHQVVGDQPVARPTHGLARNPRKLIYASSPDRGLKALLKIFARAREAVPDLELHCFYGFDNIDKLVALNARQFQWLADAKAAIERGLGQPGVTWHGRVAQRELYRAWLSAGIWCYPTNFTETSCITCMEAQALGAVPLTPPLWALADNVMTGMFIEGDPYTDPLTQARYAGELVRLACAPVLQDQLRPGMMRAARDRFNWERIVDQWEGWIGDFAAPTRISQYCFQHKHAVGRIANVGCDGDFSDFKNRGAVNVDLLAQSPILRTPTKADVLADARALPFIDGFDTVVLGDILEHMTPQDAAAAVRSAARALRPDGRVVLTVPNDHRPVHVQHATGTATEDYAPDISCYHRRPIAQAEVEDWVRTAGLEVLVAQPIDYTHFEGCGVVGVKRER